MSDSAPILKLKKTPQHVAFIMDGNLRWAKKNNLSSLEGLRKGLGTMQPVVKRAKQYGISYVTFWALSTDNWRKRGQKFTDIIMDLMREKLEDLNLFDDILAEGGELHALGDISAFPADVQQKIIDRFSQKPSEKHIDVNIGLNYGGRAEILHAVRGILRDARRPEEITPEVFDEYLYTANQPEPDLIVRTGFHQRLSGFLPWQSEYAELYFPSVFWPDFSPEEFDKALHFYSEEDRNFGGVSQGFKDYETEASTTQ